MPQHTPGPWTAQPYSAAADGFDITTADPDVTIATVHPYHERETGTAQAEADAILMAAAPDMWQILRRLETGVNPDHPDWYEGMTEDAAGEARALLARLK